jgi:hypothetical protein
VDLATLYSSNYVGEKGSVRSWITAVAIVPPPFSVLPLLLHIFNHSAESESFGVLAADFKLLIARFALPLCTRRFTGI